MTEDCCCEFPWEFEYSPPTDPDFYYCYAGASLPDWVRKVRGTSTNVVLLDFQASVAGIIRAMAVDADENIYIDIADRYVEKYDSAGALAWSTDLGVTTGLSGNPDKLEVDSSGNVYMLFNAAGTGRIKKIDSTGAVVATFSGVASLALDQSGNLYTANAAGTSVVKLDAGGVQLWATSFGAAITSIAVDASGNVYVCGTASGGFNVRRYDSGGSLTLSIDNVVSAFSIDCDEEGSIYVGCGTGLVGTAAVKKYDSTGTLVWSANRILSGSTVGPVRVDYNHNLHVAWHTAETGDTVYQRYNSSGAANVNHTETADRGRAVAVNFGRFGAFGF